MPLDCALDDCEAETVTHLSTHLCVQLDEGLKHPIALLWRDTGTIIFHQQFIRATLGTEADGNAARSVAASVVQQISQHGFQEVNIATHLGGLFLHIYAHGERPT